jgi:hypothetical protein
MARVYLEQGKVAEAAAIYRRLIKRADADAEQIGHLRELLERSEVQRREARRRTEAPPAALPARLGVDFVALVPLGPGRAACVWELTERGRAAAGRQLAAAPARLVLRLVAVSPGAAADEPGRWEREVALGAEVGERAFDTPDGGVIAAALGLRAADGSFAAITHAAPGPLPASAPAASGAARLLEVEPAHRGPDPEPAEARSVAP